MTPRSQVEQLIRYLKEARERYLAEAAQADDTAPVPPGEWNARQVGAHMAEWSEFVLTCVQRIATEPDPLIGRVLDDPSRLGGVEQRGHVPVAETGRMVATTWDELFRLVEGWETEMWTRQYRHLHYGTDTALRFLGRAVEHFSLHTAQVQRIRGQRGETGR